MGTPEFAVASLDSLLKNNFNIVGVITAPDKPAGRGQQMHQSPVKNYAVKNNLKLLQPEKLKDPGFIEDLKNLKADLQIVVAFRMLPDSVWNMPPLGTYNLHASLLPKFRGAAPINWAIINGEKETGVTTFKLKHEIDTGNILLSERVSIDDAMTAGELHDVLMNVGASLIIKTANQIQKSSEDKSELVFLPQDESKACHAPKLFKETCKINWDKPVIDIYNLIRGLSPYPTAFTQIHTGTTSFLLLKLFKVKYEKVEHRMSNGSVLTDNKNYLKIFCGGGAIDIIELQLEGKKRMPVDEFLRGFKISENSKLSW